MAWPAGRDGLVPKGTCNALVNTRGKLKNTERRSRAHRSEAFLLGPGLPPHGDPAVSPPGGPPDGRLSVGGSSWAVCGGKGPGEEEAGFHESQS